MKIIHFLSNNDVTEQWNHLLYKNRTRYTVEIHRGFSQFDLRGSSINHVDEDGMGFLQIVHKNQNGAGVAG